MDAIVGLSWKIYPAIVMMVVGTAIFVLGSRRALRGLRLSRSTHPNKMHIFVRGFRVAVVGFAIAGLGAAWNWNLLWLFVLTLIIAGEEILESTTHLAILRWKPRTAMVSSKNS